MTQEPTAETRNSTNAGTSAPMSVTSIEVKNFRLLRHVNVDLSDHVTVLVGRNNTGKTSLAEALTYFLNIQAPKFELADFSTESYELFRQAWVLYNEDEGPETSTKPDKESVVREILPEITLSIKISYDAKLSQYGPLSAIIVDLDPNCSEALVRFTYSLQGGVLSELFEGIEPGSDPKTMPDTEAVLAAAASRIPKLYRRTITAVDPFDASNTRNVPVEAVRKLITVHFLKAQRGLDDEKERPKDLIGKVFQTLFDAATEAGDNSAQKATADELTDAVASIEEDLGKRVSDMMTGLVPALERFGYPGLNNPGLEAKTSLDVTRLLANYTSIHYRGVAGVSLPEAYSGLGSRNLILMLFTLLGYYREYASRGNTPGLHLVFIEEPEAHLHPQMQEVFIEQLKSTAALFPELDSNTRSWKPQFVVSTHSSHVANRAEFSAIRYFRVEAAEDGYDGNHAEVRDLSKAKGLNVKFLHQYLTLTRSDLFFADKAILIEGTSERLIVPAAIKKSVKGLTSQYVTLLEVGGAYAHIFFPLLDFIGLPTLIITDIDTVGTNPDKAQKTATTVHQGDGTSNATIKYWFTETELTPSFLLATAASAAIIEGNRCLAYQVSETDKGACGRSFEDAFILANPTIFDFTTTGDVDKDECLARDEAHKYKKSEFALRFAIDETDWAIPRYIRRGLRWLLSYPAVSAFGSDLAGDDGAVSQ